MKYPEYCEGFISRNPRRASTIRRILRVIEEGGPRSMNVLQGVVKNNPEDIATLEKMIAADVLVKIGDRRGTLYGTPYQFRAAARRSSPAGKRAA